MAPQAIWLWYMAVYAYIYIDIDIDKKEKTETETESASITNRTYRQGADLALCLAPLLGLDITVSRTARVMTLL